MNQENILTVTVGAAVSAVLIVLIATVYQYNDGVTSLRRQAVERGCSITPAGSDYLIDCRHP